jgi:hypothetical protein
LREETGVVVRPEDLRPVFRNDRYVVFRVTRIAAWPKRLASQPFEGFVGLWAPEAFYSSSCTYASDQAQVISEQRQNLSRFKT